MPDEIATLGRGEQVQSRGDERAYLIEGTGPRGAEERFQLREGHVDRIEVRAVGWDEAELGADGLDGGAASGCVWTARLSSTRTSPERHVGTRTCST